MPTDEWGSYNDKTISSWYHLVVLLLWEWLAYFINNFIDTPMDQL